jgi:hypothetical protein
MRLAKLQLKCSDSLMRTNLALQMVKACLGHDRLGLHHILEVMVFESALLQKHFL